MSTFVWKRFHGENGAFFLRGTRKGRSLWSIIRILPLDFVLCIHMIPTSCFAM